MTDLEFFRRDKWIGEGKILIEDEEESFPIIMKILMKNNQALSPIVEFTTSIHIDESEKVMENHYTLTMHRNKTFHVLIAGESWGHVEGKGFINKDFIGWEVSSPDGLFHAYESIVIKKGAELVFNGEYAMKDEMRTKIEGKLTSYENVLS